MARPDGPESTIFDLDPDVLRRVIATAAGEPVAAFDITIEPLSHGHYGAEGDKLIATCRYRTVLDRSGSVVLFCKRYCRPGPSEAHHYEHLHQQALPLPRCFGTALDAQGREVLFLERLDTVFHDQDLLSQPDSCTAFLQLMARLNAVAVPADYARVLARADFGRIVSNDQPVLNELRDRASRGELGPELRRLFTPRAADQLNDIATHLATAATSMQPGLIHGDYFPRHIGRRQGDSTLLAFDWAHAGLGPRFFDVATYVGFDDDEFPLCLRAEQAAAVYLDTYAEAAGQRISLDDFLREARTLWLAWNFRCLRGWLRNAPNNDEKGLHARADIARLLDILLTQGQSMFT